MSTSYIIEKVENSAQIKEFVNFPFTLYKKKSLWTPNLKKQDIALLSPGKHTFWQTARRQLFVARGTNGHIMGRIAAIIDDKYNAYAKQSCGAFGFFECVNNREMAASLLQAAREWLAQNNMAFMRGPLNPSTNYSCGLLVDGFDLPPCLMMPWNPPYYAELLESWHLRKEQDLFAYTISKTGIALPDWLKEELKRVKAQNMFSFRPSGKATLKEDIRIMLDIYRQSWADNWGFSPLSDGEAAEHVKELSTILDPRFFVLFFHQDKPAAGMVALADLNPLLKKLNGKIGITAPWHFLRLRKKLRKSYRIMLFGILPEYRLYGLPLLLLDYMLEQAAALPEFEQVEGSWVLEDNMAIDDLIEDFNGKLTKRYRIYRREIGQC